LKNRIYFSAFIQPRLSEKVAVSAIPRYYRAMTTYGSVFGLNHLFSCREPLERRIKMNEIKHYGVTGMKLVYTVRQSNGTPRGPADRPLTETPPLSGFYINNDTPELVVGDMITVKDSESGNPVAAGEWKPEDVNKLPITAKGNRLWNYFLDLYERTLKAAIDAVLEKVWHK
jgi:hypothetical protein